MRLISTLVIAAAALMMVPAVALAKDCGNPPARLSLPDGSTATEDQMKATASKFPSYAQAVTAYLRCLSEQMKAGKDEYDTVAADWTKQQKIFTSQPAK
jgi:hypothetical protein